MKKFIKIYDWHWQLFWEIGFIIIEIFKGNFEGATEMYYWFNIHFTKKSSCVEYGQTTTKAKIKSHFVAFFGVCFTFIFSYFICIFINYISLILVANMNYQPIVFLFIGLSFYFLIDGFFIRSRANKYKRLWEEEKRKNKK